MAIRIIRTNDDGILRKASKPVKSINDGVKVLLDDMAETMQSKNGVGLAAVQVGVLKRIVIIDAPNSDEFVEDESELIELINPEILESSGETVRNEGCLSIPGVAGTVARPDYVKVKALDRDGKSIMLEARGCRARAVSHEIDHLNGILFTDKVIEYIDDAEDEE